MAQSARRLPCMPPSSSLTIWSGSSASAMAWPPSASTTGLPGSSLAHARLCTCTPQCAGWSSATPSVRCAAHTLPERNRGQRHGRASGSGVLLRSLWMRALQQYHGMDKPPSRTPRCDQAHRFPAVGAQLVQLGNGLLELGEIRHGVLPALHLCSPPASDPAEEQVSGNQSDDSTLAPRAGPC